MTHHQHVDVFVQSVDGVGTRRVGGGGQYVGLAHHFQNIGCMATASAFGVEGVNGAAFEGCYGVFHKTRFVQSVGVDGNLNIGFFGNVQRIVDDGGRGAPVFVKLKANHASIDLFVQCSRQSRIAFAQKAQIHGKRIGRLHHALDVVRAWRARGGEGACGRACATPQHGGNATGQCFLNLLRGNEVNVGVNATSGHDHAFATDDFGARANDDVNAGLGVWVACFADGCNAIAFEANVGFHNAPVVNDEGIGEYAIHGAFCVGALRLRHAIANGFAATKLHFFAVGAGL